jgi:CheY-like chemotaxis protein
VLAFVVVLLGREVDVLPSDIALPGLDGDELRRKIRSSHRKRACGTYARGHPLA